MEEDKIRDAKFPLFCLLILFWHLTQGVLIWYQGSFFLVKSLHVCMVIPYPWLWDHSPKCNLTRGCKYTLLLNYGTSEDVYTNICVILTVWLHCLRTTFQVTNSKNMLIPCLHVEVLRSGWCRPGSPHCHPGWTDTRWDDGGSSVVCPLAVVHEPPLDHCREDGLRKLKKSRLICFPRLLK